MSDRRFNLTETRVLTNANGSRRADITINYYDLTEKDVVELERELVGNLDSRVKWAEDRLANE